MDLKEIEWDGVEVVVDLINVAQGKDKWMVL